MQSSMAVAGMDALSESRENILTRRANQRHYSIIAQFAKRPWPCPTTGSSSAIAGKKSLPTIEVASARRSCIGSPQRRDASRVAEPRALPMREPEEIRREHSSRPQQGNGLEQPFCDRPKPRSNSVPAYGLGFSLESLVP